MTLNYLEYPLEDGYVHHWLVSPAYAVAVPDVRPADRLQASLAYMDGQIPYDEPPVDRDTFRVGEQECRWVYYHSLLDHFVEATLNTRPWQVVQAMAYVQIKSESAQDVNFSLTANTLAEVWLNGKLVSSSKEFPSAIVATITFSGQLQEGENELLIRTTDAGYGSLTLQAALRLDGFTSTDDSPLVLPTHLERPDRHYRLEKILKHAYLEDVVDYRGHKFNLRWSDELDEIAHLTYEVQDHLGGIYVTGNFDTDDVVNVAHEYRMREQPYWVVVRATDVEYYPKNLRHVRRLPIHVLDVYFADAPYGNFQTRQLEALQHAAKYDNLMAQIAKMHLGDWEKVDEEVVSVAVQSVASQEFGCELDLLGLLGMAIRFGENSAFPVSINPALKTAAINFNYEQESLSQPDQLVLLTCQLLAGQHYAKAKFGNDKTGAELCQQADENLMVWMKSRCARGFAAWDSPNGVDHALAALSHLTSLSENGAVGDLSAVLIDKILFSLAVNSYKGVHGSSHGQIDAGAVKSGQLQATTGIMRMMWGTGVFNHHMAAVVSLACSNYEFPLFIGQIANDLSNGMWNLERQALDDGEVNKVSYRTADYMLASAQDFKPGERGSAEHIWQATFGPDAFVFVNFPASMSESEASKPGFWRGNDYLPRVAQWKDFLVAVYSAGDDAWLDFTHAFFPIYYFDEYAIEDGWAFARKGDGYLALTASSGLEWITTEPDGCRELRAQGRKQVWLCQMGRASQDGDFISFQEKIKSIALNWGDLSVDVTTLRGEQIAFGWDQPLTVNGQEQPLDNFKHYDNPYCQAEFPTESMDISFQGIVMRLSFE